MTKNGSSHPAFMRSIITGDSVTVKEGESRSGICNVRGNFEMYAYKATCSIKTCYHTTAGLFRIVVEDHASSPICDSFGHGRPCQDE